MASSKRPVREQCAQLPLAHCLAPRLPSWSFLCFGSKFSARAEEFSLLEARDFPLERKTFLTEFCYSTDELLSLASFSFNRHIAMSAMLSAAATAAAAPVDETDQQNRAELQPHFDSFMRQYQVLRAESGVQQSTEVQFVFADELEPYREGTPSAAGDAGGAVVTFFNSPELGRLAVKRIPSDRSAYYNLMCEAAVLQLVADHGCAALPGLKCIIVDRTQPSWACLSLGITCAPASCSSWETLQADWVTAECRLVALQQLARALALLHGYGVFHGDMHPGNLLVDHADDPQQLHIYIIDFGASKHTNFFGMQAAGAGQATSAQPSATTSQPKSDRPELCGADASAFDTYTAELFPQAETTPDVLRRTRALYRVEKAAHSDGHFARDFMASVSRELSPNLGFATVQSQSQRLQVPMRIQGGIHLMRLDNLGAGFDAQEVALQPEPQRSGTPELLINFAGSEWYHERLHKVAEVKSLVNDRRTQSPYEKIAAVIEEKVATVTLSAQLQQDGEFTRNDTSRVIRYVQQALWDADEAALGPKVTINNYLEPNLPFIADCAFLALRLRK